MALVIPPFTSFCNCFITEGQPIDMTPMTVTPTHNVAGSTPFSKAGEFRLTMDATNSLHGKIVSSDATGLFVPVDLPYTKFTFKDGADSMLSTLNSWFSSSGNSSLVEGLMISSSLKGKY